MDLFWRIGGFYSHRQYKIRQHLPLTNRTLRHQPRALGIMAMYRYLTRANPDDNSGLPAVVTSLSSREVERVNRTVKLAMEREAEATSTRVMYNGYSATERAKIGKYAAENGPTRASRHFSEVLEKKVPESTARRLKAEYLLTALKSTAEERQGEPIPQVTSLMSAGRPLLVGKDLDTSVQEYIKSLRKVGGVVNTAILMAAANGIIAAKNPTLLSQHGGHIEITKGWAQSLFRRMGYVKRNGSNAGKITVARFQEVQDEFLADIKAEVLMNDVHPQLIFNWDQTAIQLVPTGQWTMHRSKEKAIPIANSEDKRQITAVLAVTMMGDYLPPQLVYKGKTPHLVVTQK